METGAEIGDGIRGGLGEFTVENGTASDAVVALFDPAARRAVRRIFVRAHSTGRVLSVPVGSYVIRFAAGAAHSYSTPRREFCESYGAQQFKDTVEFREEPTAAATHFVEESVTLQRVPNGNASSFYIPDSLVFADSGTR
ncbi:MAG: hypothetical protein ACYCVL_10600 [Gemmatimonadaceae bacterium]